MVVLPIRARSTWRHTWKHIVIMDGLDGWGEVEWGGVGWGLGACWGATQGRRAKQVARELLAQSNKLRPCEPLVAAVGISPSHLSLAGVTAMQLRSRGAVHSASCDCLKFISVAGRHAVPVDKGGGGA